MMGGVNEQIHIRMKYLPAENIPALLVGVTCGKTLEFSEHFFYNRAFYVHVNT